MTNRRMPILLLLSCLAMLPACDGGSEAPADPGGETPAVTGELGAATRGPRTLPIPNQNPSPPASRGSESASGPLRWDAPESWKSVPPASSMRLAQYRIEGPGGTAECVVFYFGPGQGGDAMSNAARWAGQFEQPDGSSSVDAMKITELEGAQLPVQLVSVSGTYDGGMTMTDAPPERMPGSMLLGAIVQGPDAPWFFKLTGPEETVRAQRAAFIGMMESIQTQSG